MSDVRGFLDELESAIDDELPPRRKVVERVDHLEGNGGSYTNIPESGFFAEYVIPALHHRLSDMLDSEQKATEALGAEGYGNFEHASYTPKRRKSVPFSKSLNQGVGDHLHRWLSDGYEDKSDTNINHSRAPDIAIREPAPHSVVFEVKYFTGDSLVQAQRALARSAYEAFYYRSLPNLAPDDEEGPWSFDYGCLIAYDTTEAGLLSKAWQQFEQDVRDGFWEGHGTEVMLFGGD